MGTFRANAPAFEAERDWWSEEVLAPLDRVAERGPPFWWLWVGCCRECGQGWLVGQEERQNDLYCLQRLAPAALEEILGAGRWPSTFDSYEVLLRWGYEAGRRVDFLDPMNSSLTSTMVDLARERPGIRVSELARLLSLDRELATGVARKAVEVGSVEITFDPE